MKTTKDVILDLRTKHHLSQEELAEKVHVTRQAVSRWENGETIPNIETLKKLSKLFDISINTLLGSPRQPVSQCSDMPLEDPVVSKNTDGSFSNEKKACYQREAFYMKKKLNVGVIGLGMGKTHAKGVKLVDGACLYAVCDIDSARAQEVAKELEVQHVFTDYRDMIADPALDAVIIASPDQDHRQMVIDTLDAGKHILCEKPLALTREDCEAITEAVKKSDRKFMVGQICRYTPGFMKAKELVEAGEIGELTFVESEYAHDYTHIYEQGTWRSDPARNGVVGGGCHAVDLLRWIAGDPEEVMAYGVHKTFAEITPYDDTHIAIMKFPNGVIGKVFISISCKRNYTMRSVFYGTKGTIITDNRSDSMTLYKQDADNVGNSSPTIIPMEINHHNAAGEFREFYDCIVNDKPIQTTVQEGANTIAVCMAIMDSSISGKLEKPKYFE